MTLADTASVTAPWLTVGFTGPGTLTQTGGTLSISGNPQIGRAALGTYNQSGGTFNWGGWYAVGRLAGGNGTYNLSGTGAAVGNNMIVAEAGGTIGTMTVADSASLTLNRLEVARAGTATLTQTGGQVRSGVVNIANASGTGSYSLQGGLLETPALTRGAGTPAFSFTGGTLHANFVGFSLVNDGGTVDVGPIDGRMVRVWYDGNAPTDTNPPENWNFALAVPWDVDSDTDTDWGGGDAPPLGYPGGSADYYSVVYLGQVYVPAAGNVAFREQVDDATALFVDGTRVLWDFEDTGIIDGSAGNPWETHTQNAVALTQGWHDLEIRLGDHWGGQGGVLQWDPAGGSNWQAIGAGSLRTPAQTVVLGDYTQTAAGALALDIDAATGAAEKLAVVGTLSADGDLELGLPSGLPDYYEVFDILDFAAANGQFNLISDPAYPLPPAAYWDTSLLYQTGEIWLAVPEPATWLLAGFSALLLGAAALARNRKRR